MSAGPKNSQSSAKRSQHIQPQAAEQIFARAEDMAEAIESLVHFLNKRYVKRQESPSNAVLGFIIEGLKVQFSSTVEHIEVVTHFAESSATVLVPSMHFPDQELQDKQRQELLRFFFPALKDAQLRATLQLYKTLRIEARRNLVERFGHRNPQAEMHQEGQTMDHKTAKTRAADPVLVLVVDDNENVQEVLASMLGHHHISSASALNGKQAIHYLKTSASPALIILDWDMPLMNGRQFMEARAQDPALEKIPVLIYSASLLKAVEYERFANCQFLEKHTDTSKLLSVVKNIIKQAKA